jgi:cell division protein FtsX
MKRWFSIGALLVAMTTGCAFGGGPDDAAPGGTLPPPPMLGATAVTAEDEHGAELVCRYIATRPPQERGTAMVFMEPSATDTQIATVRAVIDGEPAVSEVSYTDQVGAVAEYAALFPEIPGAETIDPAQLPASFRFRLPLVDGKVSEPASLPQIRDLPGVKRVITNRLATCDDVDPRKISAARQAQENRFGDHDIRVYIDPAKPEAVDRVRQQLLTWPGVVSVDFISQDESLKEFRCFFWDDAKMIAEIREATVLPPSFRVDAGDDPEEIKQIASEIEHMPGVKQTTSRATKAELYANLFFGAGQEDDPRQQADCPVHSEQIR